ncbi:hypothetical protein FRC04_001804 [Tulasnella sp. 424]|nr:hypothetical protein FRC04_001804 [Tulasnella sp. 424]
MSRSSSKTAIDHDTVMSDVYYYEGDRESSASTPEPIHSARPRFVKEKKAALRAADAIHKANTSKKRSIKTVKDKKKASASGTPNVPARHTRSTTRPRPDASTQIISSPEIDAAQLNEKKTASQRATLEAALVSWWDAKGADKYNHPTKMVLPDKEKSNSDWDWILAECKAMDESFDRGRNGLMIMAEKMNPLPPISDS